MTVAAGGATGGASGDVALRSGNCTVTNANTSGSSGSVTVSTGTTDIHAAAVGNASGLINVLTGNTDVNNAGGTGGATGSVSIRSGDATATAGKSGVSGNLGIASGSTDVNAAVAGSASGDVTIGSGTTDSHNGGGTAGNSGTVTLRSGACLSALGTSGTSGNVAITTGGSADAGTGNIVCTIGVAGVPASRGEMNLVRNTLSGRMGATIYSPATDSTADTGDTKAMFDRSITIPAGTLKAGDTIEITWKAVRTGINGADTILSELVVGPTPWNDGTDVVVATSTAGAHAANTIFAGRTTLIMKTTNTFDAFTQYHDYAAPGSAVISGEVDGGTLDSAVENVIGVTNVFSSANAGNTAVLEMIIVKY